MPNNPAFTMDLTTELQDDWLKARRLKELADAGDEKAKAELQRMAETKLEPVDGDFVEELRKKMFGGQVGGLGRNLGKIFL